jgi:hypothetical protein
MPLNKIIDFRVFESGEKKAEAIIFVPVRAGLR